MKIYYILVLGVRYPSLFEKLECNSSPFCDSAPPLLHLWFNTKKIVQWTMVYTISSFNTHSAWHSWKGVNFSSRFKQLSEKEKKKKSGLWAANKFNFLWKVFLKRTCFFAHSKLPALPWRWWDQICYGKYLELLYAYHIVQSEEIRGNTVYPADSVSITAHQTWWMVTKLEYNGLYIL